MIPKTEITILSKKDVNPSARTPIEQFKNNFRYKGHLGKFEVSNAESPLRFIKRSSIPTGQMNTTFTVTLILKESPC